MPWMAISSIFAALATTAHPSQEFCNIWSFTDRQMHAAFLLDVLFYQAKDWKVCVFSEKRVALKRGGEIVVSLLEF